MKDNLHRINDGEHIINLTDKKCKDTHWVSLSLDRNTTVHSDSFEYEYVPQEVLKNIEDKSMTLTYLKYNLMILWCAAVIALHL